MEAFFRSMQLLMDPGLMSEEERAEHAPGAALLAVHAAIAYADAVHSVLSPEKSTFDDHRKAGPSLRRLCGAHGRNRDGITQLDRLLSKKHRFSYEACSITLREAEAAHLHLERFASWAYRTFPELGDEA